MEALAGSFLLGEVRWWLMELVQDFFPKEMKTPRSRSGSQASGAWGH
jgi:hypothetical protein